MTDIVYITVDSLRADHLSWHGYHRETSPFLASLSENAHTFVNAFANACYTRQSFPSMMTSEYPSSSREGGRLSDQQVTIAQILSKVGYSTGGFQSNPYLGPRFGYNRGFEMYYDSETERSPLGKLRLWVKDNIPEDSSVYKSLETIFAKTQEKAGVDPGTPSLPADEMTDEAISWIQSTNDEPRFLWVHYMDVHHPYTPPEQHQTEFREEPIPKRKAIKLQRKMLDKPESITENGLNDLIDLYDAEIRFVDAEIERLIKSIREHWSSDALIAVTSDHGDEFKDHGGFSHNDTLYDELLHVPLLLEDDTEGTFQEEIVSLLDIPPTFLDYANEEIPAEFQGESLKNIIEGGSRERAYTIADHGTTVGYRDATWKYITGPDREELYNVNKDPGEEKNVHADHPDVIEKIESVLEQYPELGEQSESAVDGDDLNKEVQDQLEQLGYLQE